VGLTLLVCVVHVHETRRIYATNIQPFRSTAGDGVTDEAIGPITSPANDERELRLVGVRVVGESDREGMPLPPVAGNASKSAVGESGVSRELDNCDALVGDDLNL
jgi:hypothetical protein